MSVPVWSTLPASAIKDANVNTKHQVTKESIAGGGGVSPNTPVPVGVILQSAVVGTAYSESISAQGGTSPYLYTLSSGSLPTGLSLAGSTGLISGTPTTAGTYTFTIGVSDVHGNTGSQSFEIIVTAATAGGGAFTFLN